MARRESESDDGKSEATSEASARKDLPRKKKLIFIVMALCIPLVLLGSLEGIFRLAGYGGYKPTLYEVGPTAGGMLCTSENAGPASYFFANKSKPGSLEPTSFLMPKPKGTVRIFIGGESAAKGFPEPRCFAPSSFLEAMLRDAWPGRDVEVINLGTTAVASFPVLGMLTEALQYDPELVIVHCGNNEFFGAYGVASLHAAGNSPTAMKVHRALRGFALVQYIDNFARPADASGQRTLMEVMMGQSYTGPDDPIRADAARNLKSNIGKIIDRCKSRGVPVLVCTMAANERDLAPLGEADLSSLTPDDSTRLTTALQSAESLIDSDPPASMKPLETVLSILPTHARAQYLLGRNQFAQGQYAAAAVSFQRAIDLDPMPWRCPSRSNQAIREAAFEGGAILVDLQKLFREADVGGCVGWDLMDDHVHPSLRGQALTARSIVRAMAALPASLTVRAEAIAGLPSDDAYLRRLGDNPYDRYGVAHTIRVLDDIPFFRKSNPKAYERVDAICREFERTMPAEVVEVARQWQAPESHPGAKRPITGMVGRVMIRMGKYDEAESLYEIARRSVARYTSWNLEYNYFMLVCRERVLKKLSDEDRRLAMECIERGMFLLSHGRSESGMAERYVGRLHQLRGEWKEAIPFLVAARPKVTGTDLVAVDQALVMSYMATGKTTEALKLIDNGIENSGEYSQLYRRMRAGLEKSGGNVVSPQTSNRSSIIGSENR